jgi:plastocyanin
MLSKRARLWLGLIAAISLLALAASCGGGGGGNTNTEEPTTAAKPLPSKDAGTITGKISYTGAAPAPVKIQTDADPACAKASPNLTSEEWVVKDGKVANTFVYIKDGTLADGTKLGDYSSAVPSSPVVLDQNGCHYKPHVLGVVVNQNISITNSDPTTHNIHFMPKNNPDWNQSQVQGAPAMTHKLTHAEVLAPVKCNQHPWMKSYVGVMKTTLFAVSGEDGSFSIKGVPPGKYTVVAWHEGGTNGTEKQMEVTVAANGSATADFSFGASAELRGQPSSLQMLPALEVPMIVRH